MEARGGSFLGGYDAFRKVFAEPACRKQLAKQFTSDHPQTMRELARNNLAQVSENFGVLCLSTVSDSIAMWSHYADKHRGIVIGFDSDHPHLANLNWFTVDYSKERVPVSISWTLKKRDLSENVPRQTLTTKSEVWSYEKEIRSIFKLSDLESVSSAGRTNYFWKIPVEVISEVKLGHRCPKATENSVRAAIASSDLRYVKLKRAELDDTRFAILFRPA
jgi:hypothetical protein